MGNGGDLEWGKSCGYFEDHCMNRGSNFTGRKAFWQLETPSKARIRVLTMVFSRLCLSMTKDEL